MRTNTTAHDLRNDVEQLAGHREHALSVGLGRADSPQGPTTSAINRTSTD
ncbi:hypothetical protein [Streptomyces sviceus]